MRLSRYFLPVLKENPSEAQIVSHRLMLRAGMIRQQAAGIYSWLPLGYRVLKRIEQIVHEEQVRAVLAPRVASIRGGLGRSLACAGWLGALGALLLTPSVASWIVGDAIPHRRFHLWFLEHAALWSLVLMACIVPASAALRRTLSWRPLTALGRISYSVYLYHALALALAAAYSPEGQGGWIGPCAGVLSLVLGGLSYALVERPSLRFSRSGGAQLPLPERARPD